MKILLALTLTLLASCAAPAALTTELRPGPVVALAHVIERDGDYRVTLTIINRDEMPIKIGIHHVIIVDDAGGIYYAAKEPLITLQPGTSIPVVIGGVLCTPERSLATAIVAIPGHEPVNVPLAGGSR